MTAVAYETSGDGRPLVLLHAFPMHAAMWRRAAARLARRWSVITVDQRGFGDSAGAELPAEPDLAVSADDVAAVLDGLGADKAVVCGMSMGGYVAMSFARRHADRLAGLVLCDTKAAADSDAAAAHRREVAERVETDRDAAGFAAGMLPALLGEDTHARRPGVLADARRIARDAAPRAVAWAQRAMARRPDSHEVLENLDVPAMVVRGDGDTIASEEDARRMAAALRAPEPVTIPRAGHLPALERPAAFADTVLGF